MGVLCQSGLRDQLFVSKATCSFVQTVNCVIYIPALKQTNRNNRICSKLAYFLRKIQIFCVILRKPDFKKNANFYNSRILTVKNVKFLGYYYFYMNLNKQGDFQICISTPLRFMCKSKYNKQCFKSQSFIVSVLCSINFFCQICTIFIDSIKHFHRMRLNLYSTISLRNHAVEVGMSCLR